MWNVLLKRFGVIDFSLLAGRLNPKKYFKINRKHNSYRIGNDFACVIYDGPSTQLCTLSWEAPDEHLWDSPFSLLEYTYN